MSMLSISYSNFKNDAQSSDGKLVLFTQVVLIFFLMTLSLTSASIQNFLNDNLNNLLGSDMVIVGNTPLTDINETTLESTAIAVSKTQLIPLVVTKDGIYQKAQVKLVGDTYPLQGSVKIAYSKTADQTTVFSGPKAGEVWIGPRLSTKLSANVGDRINIGGTSLRISALIFHEPDRLMEGHSVAMRALVHANSLPVSTLASSDTRYRYLLEATSTQQQDIENWAAEELPDYNVIAKSGGGHPLALFWQRTENFLGLASVILFFMAAIAIDMANRRHLDRQKRRFALYLSFGQTLKSSLFFAFSQWVVGFVLSLLCATGLAYIAEYIVISQMTSQFPGLAWGWHPEAFLKVAGLTFILLIAFQLPAFLQLKKTSIISLIRAVEYPQAYIIRLVWGFASLILLAAYYSDNMLLTVLTLGAMGAALVLMICITWIVLTAGDKIGRRRAGLWPFAFFMMKQRILNKSSQILGLGLSSLLLLFTLMLMKDIGASVERHIRVNDGNLIISELQEDQQQALEKWATDTGSEIRQLRPFTSAKLIKINDTLLNDFVSKPSDSLATVNEPIRLSWANEMPANNQLVDGKWWDKDQKNIMQISCEPEIMTDIGLKFGDTLTFSIGGTSYDFELVSSHAFKPGGGSVTFWFQIPENTYKAINPTTYYMGSMELPDAAWDKLADLWKSYPTLSLVPLREITKRFDDTLAIVTKLTVGFAAMVLIMAAIVIAASIKGFEADDKQRNGLLMSMGLKKSDCLKLNLYDWIITALIAGTGAIAGTWLAGLMIYQSQFSLPYKPDVLWLLSTLIAISLLVCAVGTFYCRKSLSTSINELLQA